ncbi:hypothetical protein 2 [Beihai picorna-like virus 118]|uniref:hypothetical protein 2 n=1 Tax=Beihai picorna-like virus 118 TaxID=1922547 RepID=UPI00090B0F8E|nr:hypothetical protein 2 [Beihai picorna-like virus 118]APG76747.1 hypothetical protein 2 [Beihai picorna-like virus 118]
MSDKDAAMPPTASGEITEGMGVPPEMPVDAGIDRPGGITAEVQQVHTSRNDSIEAFLRSVPILQKIIKWSVNDLPGTILYQVPVHPSYVNYMVKWFKKAFKYWNGPIIFMIDLAGTGFHGGKLIIFHTPPGKRFKPSKMTMAQWFTFSHGLVDAKSQGNNLACAPDVIGRTLHDNGPFDENNEDTYGGWFGIGVVMELKTSGTGDQEIQFSLEACLAPSFSFNYIVPTNLLEEDEEVLTFDLDPVPILSQFPELTELRFHATSAMNGNQVVYLNPLGSDKGLLKEPIRTLVTTTTAIQGDVSVPQSQSTTKPPEYPPTVGSGKKVIEYETDSSSCGLFCPNNNNPLPINTVTLVLDGGAILIAAKITDNTPRSGVVSLGVDGALTQVRHNSSTSQVITQVAPNGEAIITFHWKGDTEQDGVCMTPGMAKQCQNIDPSTGTPIYTLRDAKTDQVLLWVRLNYNGFFSTTPTNVLTRISLANKVLKFEYRLAITERLPIPEGSELNRIAAEQTSFVLADLKQEMESKFRNYFAAFLSRHPMSAHDHDWKDFEDRVRPLDTPLLDPKLFCATTPFSAPDQASTSLGRQLSDIGDELEYSNCGHRDCKYAKSCLKAETD